MSFPRKMAPFVFLLLAAVAGASCQAEWDGLAGNELPGISPPPAGFYFPTGLALTPDGRYLFVTNGNSDLKYNGGTLGVVDVDLALERIQNPLDYPAACRLDPQNRQVAECEEGPAPDGAGGTLGGIVLGDLTVRLGFYPGFLALEDLAASPFEPWLPDQETGGQRRYRLYIPVRGDPSLTFVDVILGGDEGDELLCLDCGQGCERSGLRDCEKTYRVESPSPGRESLVSGTMPDEPFGIGLQPLGGYAVLAHLVTGSLSLVDLVGYQGNLRRGGPDLVDILRDVMSKSADNVSGGFNVVLRTPEDPAGWIYVSNRSASQILMLRVSGASGPLAEDRGLRMVLGPSVVLGAPLGPLEGGADVRGLAVAPDGNTLYALTRTPPALVAIDTSLQNGVPKNSVLDVVEVCPRPSNLRLREDRFGRRLAYAVCYGSGEIYVVDTAQAQVVDRIESGGGPHDLVLVPDIPEVPARRQGFGFITNFGEHSVGVLDLREDSPTYHQMIGRIGWPEELER
ncbi:MAG: hypothetical protein RBU30_24675 [Polyangia bacterium]|nr:hypothetical protein [Polyangia bacterium]